ncbi:MAG: MFS transporter [Clostridia bacterium]|nr:MFS transporter [Clostridia bacterium]
MKNRTFIGTKTACYTGYVVQGIINNIAPLLFVIFSDKFNITLDKLSLLITINFATQLIVDTLSIKFVDKIGYKPLAIISQGIAFIGLASLGILPNVLDNAYIGIVISIIFSAIGSGITEVIISPIVESIPGEKKTAEMSLLHSFYCWGQVFVVFLTTTMIKLLGNDLWYIAPVLWSIIPLINTINFISVPIQPNLTADEKTPFLKMLFSKQFLLCIVIMICSGASEIGMSQWSSYFAEAGLKVSKVTGDLLGPCLFAVFMGSGRMIFGFLGEKINLKTALCCSAGLCAICYLGTCLINNSVVSLLFCALTGITVSIMWPATLSLAARLFPKGGGSMYSVLALSGDTGCTLGPWFISYTSLAFAQNISSGESLKIGLGFGALFPVLMIFAISLLNIKKNGIDNKNHNDIIKS